MTLSEALEGGHTAVLYLGGCQYFIGTFLVNDDGLYLGINDEVRNGGGKRAGKSLDGGAWTLRGGFTSGDMDSLEQIVIDDAPFDQYDPDAWERL